MICNYKQKESDVGTMCCIFSNLCLIYISYLSYLEIISNILPLRKLIRNLNFKIVLMQKVDKQHIGSDLLIKRFQGVQGSKQANG